MPDWFLTLVTHPITLLAVGGGAGANARYWTGQAIRDAQMRMLGAVEFPWGTFLVNVLGSIALGFIAAAYLGHPDPARRNWYLLLGTGFCGGFTTFSTFGVETVELLRDGRFWNAVGYAGGSVVAGVAGAWVGLRAIR